jgi:hypothetical protein
VFQLVMDLSCFFAILGVMTDSPASFTDWIQDVLKSIGETLSNLWNSLFPVRDKIAAHPEYQAERTEYIQTLKDSLEEGGIAVDANGYVSIAELHAKGSRLPAPFYVDAKDGKLPLETLAKFAWNTKRVLQGKEMVLNDEDAFMEKMPHAIRESGGHLKVFAHDSEGNRMAFDTDTGISEVTCSDGSRRDISVLQAQEVLDRAKSLPSASTPGGKSFTIDESAMTSLLSGKPVKTPQATEIPLGDLPSPIQEVCTPPPADKSGHTR